MSEIKIDHLPTQSEINSYRENDHIIVYDKSSPVTDTRGTHKILYPITHDFVAKIDPTDETLKLYPVTHTYIKEDSDFRSIVPSHVALETLKQ